MTKRRQTRDLKKYPLDPQEIIELKKIMRSKIRSNNRAKKLKEFMDRARKHNTERGISPKQWRELNVESNKGRT